MNSKTKMNTDRGATRVGSSSQIDGEARDWAKANTIIA